MIVDVSFGDKKSKREHKGNSLLELPLDYTLVDLETSGLDPRFDDVIELCAIRCRNRAPVSTFSTLVKPKKPIDAFISDLTGITNEMLETAPAIMEVFDDFISFLGDDLILGHNVHFDINFIYDIHCEINNQPFKNNFVDTLRLARRAYPERKTNTLASLAESFDLNPRGQHRAEADCLCTQALFLHLIDHITSAFQDVPAFLKPKQYGKQAVTFTSAANHAIDPDHPLFNKVCVFTGKLDRFTRAQAMQMVADIGGISADRVTKDTNYLRTCIHNENQLK